MTTQASVHALLHPRSIAIIGASGDATRVSGRALGVLQQHGYGGNLYLVNPNRDEIAGMPTYKEVGSIAGEVDLALISVPSDQVPQVVEECGKKGVRTAYVLTAGFEGAGPQGVGLERELRDVLQRWPIRVVGPNGVGLFNVHDDIAPTFSLGADVEDRLKAGNVAVVSQSGGLAFGIFEYGLARGIGFSYVVSVGNEVDLEVSDFLEYFLEDPRTKVVLLFIEGFRSPQRIVSLLPRFLEKRKALVIAKMGSSEEARLASLSHTAHAAGPNELYSALFERFGVFEATDVPEMLDAAAALSNWDHVGGRGVGILTATGGAAIWVAEACVSAGLDIPELEPERQQSILADLVYYATARNPVDLTASGAHQFASALGTVAASPRIDAVVLAGVGTPLAQADSKSALHGAIERSGVPTVVYAHHPPSDAMIDSLHDLGLPCYPSPVGAANGIRALYQYSQASDGLRDRGTTEPSPSNVTPPQRVRPESVWCEYEVKHWLHSAGFPVPRGRLVQGLEEAVDAARTIGYPLAVKIQATALSHKANAGGVALRISNEDELRAAYQRVVEAAGQALGDATLDGILVERMAGEGIEMMVGLKTDPDLGAFIVVGAGGVLTEVVDDMVVAAAPLTETEVAQMVQKLRCWPVLAGTHGGPQRDVEALCDLVSRLSLLGHDMIGVIRELDLNPVIVHSLGEGVEIVDGLAVWADGE